MTVTLAAALRRAGAGALLGCYAAGLTATEPDVRQRAMEPVRRLVRR